MKKEGLDPSSSSYTSAMEVQAVGLVIVVVVEDDA